MNSYYSLIKINTNELSGESLTIGLILSSFHGFKVRFSKSKKSALKSLIKIDYSIIDFLEKQITLKVNEHNTLNSLHSNELFSFENFLDYNFFNYLSDYSNGLLSFSPPKTISDSVDDEKFNKLFKLFVGEFDNDNLSFSKPKHSESLLNRKVRENLLDRIEHKIHINQEINNSIVPTLSSPFIFDCIGQNGVLIGAKSMVFDYAKDTLSKNINTYISVIAQLSSKFNKPITDNKFFLIVDEPDKKNPSHDLWSQLNNEEHLIKIISSDASGLVAEIVEENNASKFLQQLD